MRALGLGAGAHWQLDLILFGNADPEVGRPRISWSLTPSSALTRNPPIVPTHCPRR